MQGIFYFCFSAWGSFPCYLLHFGAKISEHRAENKFLEKNHHPAEISVFSSHLFRHWNLRSIEPRRPTASRHGLPEEQAGNFCGDHGTAREKQEQSEEPTDCNSSSLAKKKNDWRKLHPNQGPVNSGAGGSKDLNHPKMHPNMHQASPGVVALHHATSRYITTTIAMKLHSSAENLRSPWLRRWFGSPRPSPQPWHLELLPQKFRRWNWEPCGCLMMG